MNKMIRTLITLAAFGAGSTALLAQPAVKLVVVDMAKVYDSHYKTEEANAKFRDAEQKAQEQVEELNKQGQSLVDEYKELMEQSKNTVLTPEARSKAEAEGQKKLEDVQRKQGEVQNFRTNTQRSLQQRIKTHRDLLLEEIDVVPQNQHLLRSREGPRRARANIAHGTRLPKRASRRDLRRTRKQTSIPCSRGEVKFGGTLTGKGT